MAKLTVKATTPGKSGILALYNTIMCVSLPYAFVLNHHMVLYKGGPLCLSLVLREM